jgi:hypothetical protein
MSRSCLTCVISRRSRFSSSSAVSPPRSFRTCAAALPYFFFQECSRLSATPRPLATSATVLSPRVLKKNERKNLAAALNSLLAAPSLASWRQGVSLDIGECLASQAGKTPIVIVSVAHLEDEVRSLVLGVLLGEVLSWVRTLPGSSRLRALLVFDEAYGFLPPHPNNPPTKRPLVSLMKQARAFGVGVVVATQNPMDLDYRALSNAGLWCIGRLQTDADRARVLDGLAGALGADARGSGDDLGSRLQRLAPRWFVVRNARASAPPILMQPRFAMSVMKGPITPGEVRRARGIVDGLQAPKPAEGAALTEPWGGVGRAAVGLA